MSPPMSSSSPLFSLSSSSQSSSSLRRSARTTFVSHLGIHSGDQSSLLVRERPARSAYSECFALHGAFDPPATERLAAVLRGLPASPLPLVLDLRGVSVLDDVLLTRLLKLQRELSVQRPVSFQITEDGPVFSLVCRLGLEERFGLEPVKRLLPKQPVAQVFAVPEKSTVREFATSQPNR